MEVGLPDFQFARIFLGQLGPYIVVHNQLCNDSYLMFVSSARLRTNLSLTWARFSSSGNFRGKMDSFAFFCES